MGTGGDVQTLLKAEPLQSKYRGLFTYNIDVSPSNHLFYLCCYPREFVLRFDNFLRHVVVYALLESIGESVPRLVYVGSGLLVGLPCVILLRGVNSCLFSYYPILPSYNKNDNESIY